MEILIVSLITIIIVSTSIANDDILLLKKSINLLKSKI